MMKEETKNALKFLLGLLGLFWIVGTIVQGPTVWKPSLFILLVVGGLISVFLLLRKFYTVRISQGKDQQLQEYKGRQSMQQDGPAVITGQDTRRRLEQLDSFLENGIIDKKEYAVLKKRYQSHE